MRIALALHALILALPAAHAADLPLRIDLSGRPGPYTAAQWKADWPACEFEDGISEGRGELIKRDGAKWLRIHYAVGGIGPEKGGVGWRFPFGTHQSAELSYHLRFSPDFDFVKGGKLPGLCGGPENVSGGHPADGRNGFSARLMWRADGRGEAYVYHKNQKGDYGDSFAFPEGFRFPIDRDIGVRMRVTMNAPGQRNGGLWVWITLPDESEALLVEKHDMEWRNADTFGVDGIYFDTFHGGGDSSWAPRRPCWAEFSNIQIKDPESP